MAVNYGIVRIAPSAAMDCELQYHVRMDLQLKHAKAVKRMTEYVHRRDSREMVPPCAAAWPFTLVRVCPTLCRRGTARLGAGFFQHISGI
ncbi:hypothetical protein PMI42_05102 [Bradyrhizobium sp. YR681]|uniref:hypothetical protein n=1 Tax=Bradyrhizobium sp. YR681 TaxID=1144344 RepID=UPI0002714195|nr:hypothetical protein [Bradyrhizobium sp. YR681]EJN11588.1 hypothetical protein PMI42_05102 [Bradyrhizobium sp. YR681]